jgi:hypothetical protein
MYFVFVFLHYIQPLECVKVDELFLADLRLRCLCPQTLYVLRYDGALGDELFEAFSLV